MLRDTNLNTSNVINKPETDNTAKGAGANLNTSNVINKQVVCLEKEEFKEYLNTSNVINKQVHPSFFLNLYII